MGRLRPPHSVVDVCTRRVVGGAAADHLRTELVVDAVGMALFARQPAPGLVHHSHRGRPYTACELGKTQPVGVE
ncbi:hypothetical protein [Geodermatophilus saharensis]|uniref:hypothetical protein n=1 Tax=Geodermatophilus saharensis TaxID=1137994 RepID=UPI0011403B0D|nr:hypothetical protein [Geodermatophilus saharensis]